MPKRLGDGFRARPGAKLGQDVRDVVFTVVRDENGSAAMSGFGRPCAASSATRGQVGVSAARPAIRGGATVMDSIFKPEDAPGSGSEHGGSDEIASSLGESSNNRTR
jgi:hypothetical protein